MSSFNWSPISGSSSGGVTTLNLLSGALTLAAGSGIAITDNGTNTITIASTSAGDLTLTAFGSTPSADGASLSGQALTLQPADATHPGGVSITTQSFAGDKTFTGAIAASNLSGTNTGDVTLAAVGSSPSANGASLSGQVLILQPADGTHPGLVTTGSQTFAGQKTFSTGLTGTLTGAASLNVLTSALGNLTDVGTDGIVVTGGTGAVVGTVSLAQHVADTTHNGYLSSTDWNTFNSKQATVSFGAFGSTPNSSGGGISGGVITLQPADGTNPGGISTGAQTIAGAKTFSTAPILSSLSASQAVVTDGSKNLSSLAYASANTLSALVQRDGSGNFSAGTITAALTGTASGNTTYSANNHGVVLSSATNAMTVVAPDASTTKVLTSGGSGADPTWAAVTASSFGTQTAGTFLAGPTSGSAATPTFRALQAPTITIKTSSSGTYTVPAGVLWLRVKMIGGGGGGAGSGTTAGTAGTNGGDTTFSVHGGATILSAGGGSAAAHGSTAPGGAGGIPTLAAGATPIISMNGNDGAGAASENNTNVSFSGGAGGAGPWGGAGLSAINTGGNSVANSGAGGPGGGMSGVTNGIVGGGGGAGAYIEAIVTNPSASYDYSVGGAGSGQALGTSGAAGGNGGSGIIIFEEYYQ